MQYVSLIIYEIDSRYIYIYIYIYILILWTKTKIAKGVPEGGWAKFWLFLLLEIRPSSINTNIFILIKEIQQKFRGVPGWATFFSCFIIRDGTITLYQYFHINQINSNKYFLQGRPRVEEGAKFLFSLLLLLEKKNYISLKTFIKQTALRTCQSPCYIFF